MTSGKLKIESGIQLLTRLIKKPDIGNFYPVLFQSSLKSGDLIEMFSENSISCLLIELITEALIPSKFGGAEASVLIFNTDGNLNYADIISAMKKKVLRMNSSKTEYSMVDNILHEALRNLYICEIYDATQLYTTIQNLESILMDYSNISLIIFDTLTAFYWSEQGYKITKMDLYVKNLLLMIKRITKEYRITCLYTRPEYFTSNKELDNTTDDLINYHIKLIDTRNGNYHVYVKAMGIQFTREFCIDDDGDIKWL